MEIIDDHRKHKKNPHMMEKGKFLHCHSMAFWREYNDHLKYREGRG